MARTRARLLHEQDIQPLAQRRTGMRENPALVGQVGEPYLARLQKRMARTTDDQELVLVEQFEIEIVHRGPAHDPPQHQVEFASGERRHQHVVDALDERHPHAGMPLEQRGHGTRHEFGRSGRHGAYREGTRRACCERVQFLARGIEIRKQATCMPDHGIAVEGGRHAPPRTLEERHTHCRFQFMQQLGGGRLGHSQLGCSTAQVPEVAQCGKQQDLAHLEPAAQQPVGMWRRGHRN